VLVEIHIRTYGFGGRQVVPRLRWFCIGHIGSRPEENKPRNVVCEIVFFLLEIKLSKPPEDPWYELADFIYRTSLTHLCTYTRECGRQSRGCTSTTLTWQGTIYWHNLWIKPNQVLCVCVGVG